MRARMPARVAREMGALVLGVASLGSAAAAALEVTVVDKEGKAVQDAVVVAVPARDGGSPPVLPTRAVVQQEKLQFVPAVTVVPAGAKVAFENLDPFDHHVRGTKAALNAMTDSSGGFELRLEGRKGNATAKTQEVVLNQPGPILLGCYIHGSMRGHIFVASSPWTRKTDAEGRAIFEGLPAGPAQVRVWQAEQLLDLPPAPVTLGATPVQAKVQLQVVPRRRRL